MYIYIYYICISTAPWTAGRLRGVLLAHQLPGGPATPLGLELVHIHEPIRRAIGATCPGPRVGTKEVHIVIPRRQEASGKTEWETGTTGFP